MSILTHGRQTYLGTAAERAGTTPDAEAVGVRFFETDTSAEYVWDGSAWVSVGGGWKIDNVIVVSSSGEGDYTSFSAAVAAAGAGDTILLDEGTYTCNNVSLGDVKVIGMGNRSSILRSTTTNPVITTTSTSCVITDLGVDQDFDESDPTKGIYINGGVNAYRVRVTGSNPSDDLFAWHYASGTAHLYDCEADVSAAGGTPYALVADSPSTNLHLYGGRYEQAISLAGAGSQFFGPKMGSTIAGASGAFYGFVYDSNHYLLNRLEGAIYMDERSAKPGNPTTNSWALYFKSDGLYYVDDAGTETGPLS